MFILHCGIYVNIKDINSHFIFDRDKDNDTLPSLFRISQLKNENFLHHKDQFLYKFQIDGLEETLYKNEENIS